MHTIASLTASLIKGLLLPVPKNKGAGDSSSVAVNVFPLNRVTKSFPEAVYNRWLCVAGFKKLYQQEGEPPPFFAASCELGLGLIPILGI